MFKTNLKSVNGKWSCKCWYHIKQLVIKIIICVKNTIKQLKNRRSPRAGGINADLLKNGTENSSCLCHKYLQKRSVVKMYPKAGKQLRLH